MYNDHYCTSRERKLIFKIERYFREGHLKIVIYVYVHMNMCVVPQVVGYSIEL